MVVAYCVWGTGPIPILYKTQPAMMQKYLSATAETVFQPSQSLLLHVSRSQHTHLLSVHWLLVIPANFYIWPNLLCGKSRGFKKLLASIIWLQSFISFNLELKLFGDFTKTITLPSDKVILDTKHVQTDMRLKNPGKLNATNAERWARIRTGP